MKKLSLLFLLVFLLLLAGCALQQHKLAVPAVQFQYVDTKTNPYVEILHLKDTNALILKTAIKNIHSPADGDFLVKDSKGNLTYYLMALDTIMYTKHFTGPEKDSLWNLFNEAATINKTVVEDSIEFCPSDGYELELEIYQQRYFTKIASYYPEYFIQENIGAAERSKMVRIAKKISRGQQVKAKSFTDIQKFDTIYIHFTYGKGQTKEHRLKKYFMKTYYFHRGGFREDMFPQQEKDSVKVSRSFLKQHEAQTVDYLFFIKHELSGYSLRGKTLILIDDNGKECYLKRVVHLRPFR